MKASNKELRDFGTDYERVKKGEGKRKGVEQRGLTNLVPEHES